MAQPVSGFTYEPYASADFGLHDQSVVEVTMSSGSLADVIFPPPEGSPYNCPSEGTSSREATGLPPDAHGFESLSSGTSASDGEGAGNAAAEAPHDGGALEAALYSMTRTLCESEAPPEHSSSLPATDSGEQAAEQQEQQQEQQQQQQQQQAEPDPEHVPGMSFGVETEETVDEAATPDEQPPQEDADTRDPSWGRGDETYQHARAAPHAGADGGEGEHKDFTVEAVEDDQVGKVEKGAPNLPRHSRRSVRSRLSGQSAGKLYVLVGPGRCPRCCVCIGLALSVAFTVVGVLLKPWKLQMGFAGFLKTDVPASARRDVYKAALSERDTTRRLAGHEEPAPNLHPGARRLEDGAALHWSEDLQIAYEVKPESRRSILDPYVLKQMAEVESAIRGLGGFQRLCQQAETSEAPLCDPGMSYPVLALPTLVYAGDDIVPSLMNFSQFREPVSQETVAWLIETYDLDKVVLPQHLDVATMGEATMLRTVFRFKIFCCWSAWPRSEQLAIVGAIGADWDRLVEDEVLGVLRSLDKEDIHVYYAWTGLEGAEFMSALHSDMMWAIGSICTVLLYLLIHTRSFFLAFIGILVITLSIPISYVLFALMATSTINLAFFLSAFLAVGLGSDIVFVYTGFWRMSESLKDTLEDRAAWTVMRAGKASLASSVTTSISFFANLAMVLKPLRQFGFFMGLCIATMWLLMALIFMPACMWEGRCATMTCQFPVLAYRRRASGCFAAWPRRVHQWRKPFSILPIASVAVMLPWAISRVEVDSGVPNIFPPRHNQNRGQEVLGQFLGSWDAMAIGFDPPPGTAEICREYEFGVDGESCPLFWCEAVTDSPVVGGDECACYRKYSQPTYCASVKVTQRIVADRYVTQEQATSSVADFIELGGAISLDDRESQMQRRELAPLKQLVWETGEDMLRSMTEVEATGSPGSGNTCGWQDLCYCGAGSLVCKLPDAEWQLVSPTLTLDMSRRLQESRVLAPARLAKSGPEHAPSPPMWSGFRPQPRQLQAVEHRTEVEVVFGLILETHMPLLGDADVASGWSFNLENDFSEPWAQRDMYSFCTTLPEDLLVVKMYCWIESFRDWLSANYPTERFPLPDAAFDDYAYEFAQYGLTGDRSSRGFLWLREGIIMASYMVFETDMDEYTDARTALDAMARWDARLDAYNLDALSYAAGAFHTSSVWARASAQDELVSSTMATFAIVLAFAFMAMLLFTRDLALSFLVVLSTAGVIVGLFWFIVVLMRWKIGAIEVIALIVFIGYAVTYPLHIAHKYSSPEAADEEAPEHLRGSARTRYQCVAFALRSIGSAATGSAFTTVGCAIFLLPCSLSVFQKLGGVVLAVTIMSIFAALAPVPALLFMLGPVRPGRLRLPSLARLRAMAGSRKGRANRPDGALLAATKDAPPPATRGSSSSRGSVPPPRSQRRGVDADPAASADAPHAASSFHSVAGGHSRSEPPRPGAGGAAERRAGPDVLGGGAGSADPGFGPWDHEPFGPWDHEPPIMPADGRSAAPPPMGGGGWQQTGRYSPRMYPSDME